MSFEGYYQVRCENKHYYIESAYNYSHSDPCPYCNAPTKGNMVDETNGDAEGFDPDFMNGCDVEVTIWQSKLDRMRKVIDKLSRGILDHYDRDDYGSITSDEYIEVEMIRQEFGL